MLALRFSTIFVVLILLIALFVNLSIGGKEQLLRRRKRYVAFPEGSSVAATICLTIGMLGNPNKDYISWAENWGVAYDLPSYKWAREHANGFRNVTKAEIQRRSRRDLYQKIEMAMERLGFNGPACIKRALCESARFLNPARLERTARRGNMVEEIIKTLFSFPNDNPLPTEDPSIHHYDGVYRRARRQVSYDCSAESTQCHISLLDLAFGKYSTPNNTPTFSNMPLRAYM